MVFESLLDPRKAERRPVEMLGVGAIYATLAVLISLFVFQGHGNFVMVSLTMLACVHLMYGVLQIEEQKDKEIDHEKPLIKEHGKALAFFMFLFLGITIGYAVWFLLLPAETSATMFEMQLDTIKAINAPTGSAVSSSLIVGTIFFSNMKVLTLVLLFSFFYGAGAIFILTWNASVIAAAIGTFVKANMTPGVTGAAVYASNFAAGMTRYFVHGIPEISAYFLAALAGGIISVAVINHDLHTPKFKHIVMDSVDLILLSVAVLLVAALVEVFITPILF